jgi:hypothetical protein
MSSDITEEQLQEVSAACQDALEELDIYACQNIKSMDGCIFSSLRRLRLKREYF